MVKIEKLNKYFNRRKPNQIHIINNVSLELGQTGLIAILGQSGSGKTTLLNTIGGLDKVNKGKIYINGKKITKRITYTIDKIRNANIGYIFQDYKLIENMTVYNNVAISLKMIGIRNKKEIKQRVDYVLQCVNMYRYRNRPAKMLSGGEKQRVAIARAIVKNPNIILADEPTGNLDSRNSLEIMNIIKTISQKRLVILVTHEEELARFYATRIIEFKNGQIEKDYENTDNKYLDYRLDNKIYLKDFKNIETFEKDNIKLNLYSNKNENLDIKLVTQNGNIYIKAENKKVEVVDENSIIEFVDEHYKKIDKSIYQEFQFDIENNKKKPKYKSIYGIFKSLFQGFKKIGNYTVIKKMLLIGYFASAMFIMYSMSSIFASFRIDDKDFITKNKNYLQVNSGKIDINKYLQLENQEDIDYIIPGDSLVSLKMKFDDYYQTSKNFINISGSLSSIDELKNEDIIYGRLPENQYEVVLDRIVIDRISGVASTDGTSYYGGNSVITQVGIKQVQDILDKKISIDYLKDFTVVGIVDKGSPSIYMNKDNFINVLNNTSSNNENFTFGFINSEQNTSEKVEDYNLFLDDITLEKGRFPTNDYEVIVNIANKDEMKLNKTIDTQINDVNLKVVGYYESKTNIQNYLVNNNTVKYSVLSNNESFTIYPKNKELVYNRLKNEENLNIIDNYEYDKQQYIESQKEEVKSNLIFVGIILCISLIEIYLMMRSSFLSRIKEIGILRAIGVKRMDIYRMFIGEIFAITSVASLTGILFMAYVLNVLANYFGIQNMYIINFTVIGLSILIVYVFNLIVGLLPVAKVLRKTPASILARHDVG